MCHALGCAPVLKQRPHRLDGAAHLAQQRRSWQRREPGSRHRVSGPVSQAGQPSRRSSRAVQCCSRTRSRPLARRLHLVDCCGQEVDGRLQPIRRLGQRRGHLGKCGGQGICLLRCDAGHLLKRGRDGCEGRAGQGRAERLAAAGRQGRRLESHAPGDSQPATAGSCQPPRKPQQRLPG